MSGLYGRWTVRATSLRSTEVVVQRRIGALLMHVVKQSTQPTQQLFAARCQRVGAGGTASAV